ncbi:hypothetical protein GCM10007924_16300 [Sneathiella chinensis]|uniref:DUF2007 domain-containing protein n=1 Tax=Sneathiella chinensis TaxID=349750 RepID=A0ABQ5U2L6_9PROT|nr:hypothetical protein GCM10007924_16300 [Sneathiella chinensis]
MLISYIVSVLEAEDIRAVVLDEHTSILEGSIGAVQRRIMVRAPHEAAARSILEDIVPGEAREQT